MDKPPRLVVVAGRKHTPPREIADAKTHALVVHALRGILGVATDLADDDLGQFLLLLLDEGTDHRAYLLRLREHIDGLIDSVNRGA